MLCYPGRGTEIRLGCGLAQSLCGPRGYRVCPLGDTGRGIWLAKSMRTSAAVGICLAGLASFALMKSHRWSFSSTPFLCVCVMDRLSRFRGGGVSGGGYPWEVGEGDFPLPIVDDLMNSF